MKEIMLTLDKLDDWIVKNKFKGFDPYDIWGGKFTSAILRCGSFIISGGKPKLFCKITRGAIYLGDMIAPNLLRSLFGINREINPKALALLLKSYLNLYKVTGKEKYQRYAKHLFQLIYETKNDEYGGYGWGYPFNWQFLTFIPRGTPSAVVTSFVVDSLIDYYSLFKDSKVLTLFDGIYKFLTHSLNISTSDNNSICFSYTPLDKSHVINVTALVSKALIQIGQLMGYQHAVTLAEKAVNYVVDNQLESGGFYYYGREEPLLGNIDHYHNVYIYLSLKKVNDILHNPNLSKAIKKWESFYLREFFIDDMPCYTPGNIYPIDSHTLANALIALSELKKDYYIEKRLDRIIEFLYKNFMDRKKGTFYYKVERIGPVKLINPFHI